MPARPVPTTTDFVHDYAAKRAAQMERAKKLREERQQQVDQQQHSPHPAPERIPIHSHQTPPSNPPPTNLSARRGAPQMLPAARSSRVIHVMEDDFKRATRAGIITPDQARQLWAMLSDQIVHTDGGVRAPVSSVASSVANQSDAQESVSQTPNPTASRVAFGNSISLDSLRASIAQFKAQQQQQQQQQQTYVGLGEKGVVPDGYEGARRGWAPSGGVTAKPTRRDGRTGSASGEAMPNTNAEDAEAEEADGMDQWLPRHANSPPRGRREKGKPAWNFDVEVDHQDAQQQAPQQPLQAQPQHAPPKRVPTKRHGAVVAPNSHVSPSPRPFGVEEAPTHPTPAQPRAPIKKRPNAHANPTSTAPVVSLDDVVVGRGEAVAMEAASNEPLVPCGLCGRTFRASILARHEKACQQLQKKRRAFDVKGQRLDGIEGIKEVQTTAAPPSLSHKKRAHENTNQYAGNVGKLPKWKIQHEQFQAAMRAMRELESGAGAGKNGTGKDVMMAGGKRLPPPPAPLPEAYDDRVPCPHCGRKFAEDVANRHIPKCATTIAKPKGIRPTRR